MCVVSMVTDHYLDKWKQPTLSPAPQFYPYVPVNIPTQQEIDEFHKLLKRAREYDNANNEPDCEIDEKKKKLLELSEQLGIKINFE